MTTDTMITSEDIARNDAEQARQRAQVAAKELADQKLLEDLVPRVEHLTLELDAATERFEAQLADFVDGLLAITQLRSQRRTMAKLVSKYGGSAEARTISPATFKKLKQLDMVLKAYRFDGEPPLQRYLDVA